MGIIENSDLDSQIKQLKEQRNSIVFTNGCFDILHKGHLEYLSHSSDLGDRLVIGLNSDNSVRKIKGDARPINDQESRAFALASLGFVDAIVIFEEETPEELIKALTPNILVKGSDYLENEIVGGT